MPAKKIRLLVRLLGLFILFAAVTGEALTLGRLRGAALVGQSLDVAVQVQLSADDNPQGLCFEADVFHGDTRQDPGRVQVTVQPTQTSQLVNLRVQSQVLIDEPVVTVYVRAGCTQQSSRRYVMLADVVSEPLAAVAPQMGEVPLIQPTTAVGARSPGGSAVTDSAATQGVPSARGAGSRSGPRNRATTVAPARKTAVARSRATTSATQKPVRRNAAVAAPPPAQSAEKLQAGKTAGQSRLKLDPLEVLSERVASLETSTASVPGEAAAREAREAQRISAMEANLKSLVALAAKNEASLSDLKARLQQAEAERYRNPLVYLLLALLLAGLVLLALLVMRGNRRHARSGGGNWWSGAVSAQPTELPPETRPPSVRRSGFAPMSAPGPLAPADGQTEQTREAQQSGPRSLPAPITQVDASLVEMSESTFDRLMQSGTTHSAIRKPRPGDTTQSPQQGTRRSVNSEELFDLRQQAEFFVSLGQTDQAVSILERRISEAGDSSPAAYLDLLKIFHSLGLRADFRQVSEDFGLLFNVQVPEFSRFMDEGRDLDAYPDTLAAIAAAWATPGVFATIEASLFRDRSNAQREGFDLAAFRDLLLLHAVAPGGGADVGEPRVALIAAAASRRSTDAIPPVVRHGDVPLPTLDGSVDLDIDLSDLHVPQQTRKDPRARQAADGIVPPSVPAINNLIDFDLPDTPAKGGSTQT